MRGRTRAAAGGKLASTKIITCVHTCAVAERRRSGSKNRSARNGSNTPRPLRVRSASAPRPLRVRSASAPRPLRVRSASAPRMCEHTRGRGAGISKSARLRSATAPRMCEHSPDLNLTPLAAFLRFCRAQRGSDRTVLEIMGWTVTREMNHIEAWWWKILHWQ